MRLTRAEATTLEMHNDTPEYLRADVRRKLDTHEGMISVSVKTRDLDKITRIINPLAKYERPRGGYTNWIIALALAGSALISSGERASAYSPYIQCEEQAIAIGAEGHARDSIRMHLLGCDDTNGDRHYVPIGHSPCANHMRDIAHKIGPRPYKVRQIATSERYTIYEDGTCGGLTW